MNDTQKKIKFSYSVTERHWVGDGFYVYGLLRPTIDLVHHISPFILLDYASPKQFPQSDDQRGVGEHPHRGFETVTFAYQGEVEHLDSSGGGGVIKEGDVQWMTAGRGIVHQEYHSKMFSQNGGVFEMVQLWVNLPKKDKMTKPKYQAICHQNIPIIQLGNHSFLRVIAGDHHGVVGPAKTFTPMNVYDLQCKDKTCVELPFAQDTNTILLIMSGSIEIENNHFSEKNILIFTREGHQISFETSEDFKGLILNGQPIDEPVVAKGPFVMNTEQEILEAFMDYSKGNMGKL